MRPQPGPSINPSQESYQHMNILEKIIFFAVAQRDAQKNYTILSDIESVLHDRDLCPESPDEFAPMIERNFEAVDTLAGIAGKALAQSFIAQHIARATLENIISEADEVKKPNGTTRKLRRMAAEGLAELDRAVGSEDEANSAAAA